MTGPVTPQGPQDDHPGTNNSAGNNVSSDPASWSITTAAPDGELSGRQAPLRGLARAWGGPLGVLVGYLIGAVSLAAKEPGPLSQAAFLELPLWFVTLAAVHVLAATLRSTWVKMNRGQRTHGTYSTAGAPDGRGVGSEVRTDAVTRAGATSVGVVDLDTSASGARGRSPLAVILINALLPATLAGAAIGTDFGNRVWSYTGSPELSVAEDFTAMAPVPPGGRLVDSFDAEQPADQANIKRYSFYEVDEEWTAPQIAQWLTSDAWGELPGYGRVVVANCYNIVDIVCTGLWPVTAQNPVSPRLQVTADGTELRLTFEVERAAVDRLPDTEVLSEVWALPAPPGQTLVQVLTTPMAPQGCSAADLTYAPTAAALGQFDPTADQDRVYDPQLSPSVVDAFSDELVAQGFEERGDRLSAASGAVPTSLYLVKPGSTSTSGMAVNVFSFDDSDPVATTESPSPSDQPSAQPGRPSSTQTAGANRRVSVDVVVC